MQDNINKFPGYHVTKDGRIFSRRLKGPSIRLGNSWKEISPMSDNFGRKKVVLTDINGKKFNLKIHRLVLEAYIGPCPKGMICCHNDGNNTNNNLNNLRWDTIKNNSIDIINHGNSQRGEKSCHSKLKEEDIQEIRKLKSSGLSYKKIGKIYNVDYSTIYKIIKNKRWKHIFS